MGSRAKAEGYEDSGMPPGSPDVLALTSYTQNTRKTFKNQGVFWLARIHHHREFDYGHG